MVTLFKNFNEVVEHKSLPVILEEIRTGKYRHAIVYLRKSLAEKKEEAYNKAKKSLLAFTPSSKFVGGRKMEFLAEYSNTIILDIDKLSKEDLAKANHLANQSEFTYASFISPSGNGLKILVKINTPKSEHKESFLKVQAHYEELLKLEIDKSGKDITRLCFYSYDEKLYYNENAAIFASETQQSVLPLSGTSSPPMEGLGVVGPNLPQKMSGGENFETIYNHCIKFTEKKVQYTNGSRNVFVHQLACNMNRKAVPIETALGYILTDFGYDEKEVTQAVNSAYANTHDFGKNSPPLEGCPKGGVIPKKQNKPTTDNNQPTTAEVEEDDENKPKPTQIDRLELFLSNRYIFRHNIVSGKLEFQYFGKRKWNVMNDFIENSMLRE